MLVFTTRRCFLILFCINVSIFEHTHCVEVEKFHYALFNKDGKTIRTLKGEEIRKYMNLTVDPCVDFYEYACGNFDRQKKWLTDHTSPIEETTPTAKLQRKINNDLKYMLSENLTRDDNVTEGKIKTFFKTCLNAERNGLQQQQFFSEIIQNNSGFPAVPGATWFPNQDHAYNWQEVIAELHLNYDISVLIGFDVDINRSLRLHNSLYLTQPPTTIPIHLCNAEAVKKWNTSSALYIPIIQQVSDNLKEWLTMPKKSAFSIAQTIVNFEYDLCIGMLPAHEALNDQHYSRRTLQGFTSQFHGAIDFNTLLTASFGTPFNTPIFMYNSQYFDQLIKTINDHDTKTLANYIMYRTLEQLSLPRSNRSDYCVQLLKMYFPKITGEMYKRKYVNVEIQTYINDVFVRLKDFFYAHSLHKEWFTRGDRGKVKIHDIELHYSQYESTFLTNFDIKTNNYWHNLAKVMAYNCQEKLRLILTPSTARPKDEIESYDADVKGRYQQRHVEIGWGLLQPPFYDEEYPNAMKFGYLGQQLARELVAIFDHILWTYYTNRTSTQTQWDMQTMRQYVERTRCFQRQLSNYLYNRPDIYKNVTTQRRIIANTGALNIAFNAYLTWLDFLNPNNDFDKLTKETLPELNFSNTQLFFIAYAQTYCHRTVDEQTNYRIVSPLMKHTLERYEVNGPLRNFNEFAKEFRCTVGSEMNPADKCILY